MPKKSVALVPIQPNQLTTSAAQLKVVLDVNADALSTEVAKFTGQFHTLQIAEESLQVVDETTYTTAGQLRNQAVDAEAGLTAIFKRLKDPVNAVRAVILDMEHGTVDPFGEIKKSLNTKMSDYLKEQKKLADAAQKRVNTVAKAERKDLLEQAEELISQGFVKEGNAMKAQAAMVTAPIIPSIVPKVDGIRTGAKYVASVENIAAVMQAILSGHVDLMQEVKPGDIRPLVTIDQVVLNAMVARQGAGLKIPGVKVEEDFRIGKAGGR